METLIRTSSWWCKIETESIFLFQYIFEEHIKRDNFKNTLLSIKTFIVRDLHPTIFESSHNIFLLLEMCCVCMMRKTTSQCIRWKNAYPVECAFLILYCSVVVNVFICPSKNDSCDKTFKRTWILFWYRLTI